MAATEGQAHTMRGFVSMLAAKAGRRSTRPRTPRASARKRSGNSVRATRRPNAASAAHQGRRSSSAGGVSDVTGRSRHWFGRIRRRNHSVAEMFDGPRGPNAVSWPESALSGIAGQGSLFFPAAVQLLRVLPSSFLTAFNSSAWTLQVRSQLQWIRSVDSLRCSKLMV
jgi:hypothetical protein